MPARINAGLNQADRFMNRLFSGLTPHTIEVATESGRAMSRVIEASDKGLPALSAKMEVNVVSPEEQAKFAEAAQPAVRALIEEQYGAEGTAMLDSLLSSIEEEKAAY